MSEVDPNQDPNSSPLSNGDPSPAIVEPIWPEQWREHLLGGPDAIKDDQEAVKELERLQKTFKAPNDMYKSFRAMEKEYSKRAPRIEFDPEMPEDKLQQYREQEGIPGRWQDYDLTFENGLTVGEDSKDEINNFLEYAHGKNMPNAAVKNAVEWYLDSRKTLDDQYGEQAYEQKMETERSLRAEWGPEYKANMNAIKELFVDHPEVESKIMRALGEDGFVIGNNRDILGWAVDIAKKLNPLATMTLPGNESGVKNLEARLAELKAIMRDDREGWYRDPALRKEYEELIEKRDALDKRNRE